MLENLKSISSLFRQLKDRKKIKRQKKSLKKLRVSEGWIRENVYEQGKRNKKV